VTTTTRIIAAFVEWQPLIELLGWVVGALVVVFSGALGAVWLVASGAKRCASNALVGVARADEQSQAATKAIAELTKEMRAGFKRTHERLDLFIRGDSD
jgi:hypothetical protein